MEEYGSERKIDEEKERWTSRQTRKILEEDEEKLNETKKKKRLRRVCFIKKKIGRED